MFKVLTKVVPINPENGFPPQSNLNVLKPEILESGELSDPVDINTESGDYSKLIVYYIMKHDTPKLYIDNQNIVTKQTSKERMDEIQDLVRKRYDYIFTGRNDQVNDFDLNFNTAFLIPFTSTLRNKDAQNAQGAENINIADEQERDKKRTEKLIASCLENGGTETEILASTGKNPDGMMHNLESTSTGDRSFFNSLLSQSMQSGDLIKIELDIKGDPDWLGKGFSTDTVDFNRLELAGQSKERLSNPFAFQGLADNGPTADDTSGREIQFVDSPPMVAFRLLPPGLYDENTGLYNVNENAKGNVINGLYYVLSLTSKFQGGKFVQLLNCVKEVRVFPDQIEENLGSS
jgi:hypothetical protein